MRACASTPVSWLRLEQYAVGELAARDAAAVKQHVADCPACRDCLDEIEQSAIELPPLPVREPAPVRRPWQRWLAWGGTGALVATAAVLLLIVLLGRGDDRALPGQRVAIKGGDLAIEVVRDDAGDRIKVLVTCPPAADGADTFVDIVVDQTGERFFPLARTAIPCGNRIALPGALRVTDRPATICAVLAPPPRPELTRRPLAELGDAACLIVRPTGP